MPVNQQRKQKQVFILASENGPDYQGEIILLQCIGDLKKSLEYKRHSEPIICIQRLKYLKKNNPDRQFF